MATLRARRASTRAWKMSPLSESGEIFLAFSQQSTINTGDTTETAGACCEKAERAVVS